MDLLHLGFISGLHCGGDIIDWQMLAIYQLYPGFISGPHCGERTALSAGESPARCILASSSGLIAAK
ncbi:hypothetical protein ACSDR0_11515 [Streptosporangium sp. G11]|uniref:hypothetical protein n=1 Tax=Streptosporangium sp. G11 TaxID=3436926 RepID=UPI003EBAA0C1